MAPRANRGRVVVISPVVPYPALGGGHKRTLRLIEAIERAGGSPHILTADVSAAAGAGVLRERGWALETFPEPPGTLRMRARQHRARLPSPYVPGIAARVRELASDCAFVQVEQTQCAYYDACFGDAPWVLSMHNVDSALFRSIARGTATVSRAWLAARVRSSALGTVERRVVPSADAVLCVSEDDRDVLARLDSEPLVVPNGVDDSFFEVATATPDEERVLFFGQFDYEPNAHGITRFLREGWPRLAADRPDARLVLAGKGMSPELERVAAAAERVETIGFVERLEHALADCRLTIVPLWEGGGTRLKVLEALAAARTVVGTALGVEGLGFEHERHGLLADTPAGIADATARLLADRTRAEELAGEGRRLAERFRWSEATRPAIALYERLLQSA